MIVTYYKLTRIATFIIGLVCALGAFALTPEELSKYTVKAEEGDDYSQMLIMDHFQRKKDYQTANKWAHTLHDNTSASEKRRGMACQYLGVNAYNGNGMTESTDDARNWWKLGAELGDDHSARLMAEIHDDSRLPALLDRAEAWIWYVKAADLGNNHCCRLVARQYDEAPPAGNAVRPDSIYPGLTRNIALSTKYWEKFLSSRKSYKPAEGGYVGYYRKGYPDIYYLLAGRYFTGEDGVTQDFAKAVEYYVEAVNTTEHTEHNAADARPLTDEETGEAMWRISTCYRFGRGVVQNELTARKWTRRAAAKGHRAARQLLGKN